MISIGSLAELIEIIPELIYLFLPGFIFMRIYIKIFDVKIDISVIILWSLFVSSLIQTFYSTVHNFWWTSSIFEDATKNLIYIITGVVLPFFMKLISICPCFKKFIVITSHRTLNKNIFDDVIDFKKKTMAKVYLKNLDKFYLGSFSLIEEKGKDSYISLINYALLDIKTCDVIYKGEKSSVVFNLNDIERIEFFYEGDSKTWEWLSKEI